MSADTRTDPPTPDPLTPEEEALYREGLREAPSINHRYGPDPVTLHGISTAEWADRCRRLLATLDRDRAALPSAPDQRLRDEFVEDHLLRHLPTYINGPLWRCICTASGDSQPGFGADGWRKHIGLSIGHPASVASRRVLVCQRNESAASAHGHTDDCYVRAVLSEATTSPEATLDVEPLARALLQTIRNFLSDTYAAWGDDEALGDLRAYAAPFLAAEYARLRGPA